MTVPSFTAGGVPLLNGGVRDSGISPLAPSALGPVQNTMIPYLSHGPPRPFTDAPADSSTLNPFWPNSVAVSTTSSSYNQHTHHHRLLDTSLSSFAGDTVGGGGGYDWFWGGAGGLPDQVEMSLPDEGVSEEDGLEIGDGGGAAL